MLGNIKELFYKHNSRQSPVFLFSCIILFWTLFDCIMSYITPLVLEQKGFSISIIGLIIGFSSMAGASFDFLISKFLKNTDFRRIILVMFIICSFYPLLLWQAKSVWFFLYVMAVWGLYFDLYGFGVFSFIGRYTKKKDHSSKFGIVQIFRAIGTILGPLIIGLIVIDKIDWRSFALGWVFLAIGFCFFIALIIYMRKYHPADNDMIERRHKKSLLVEIRLWKKLSKLMLPVLLTTFYLFFVEAFFWTLAPLYAETTGLGGFGSLFLLAYIVPALLVGWFVSSLTKRFGKKKVAFWGMLIGSGLLSFFIYLPNPITSIMVVFIASCFISISLPAINAAYADYISEAPQVEYEIEGIEDCSFNFGYVLGPISAGLLADFLSIPAAFSILGIIGVALAYFLLVTTPKHITIKTTPAEL